MLNHKYPNEIIKAIRADEPGVFDAVDRMYRKAFIQQAKYRFPATPGDIEDGWQDAMIDFYQGIKSEKITEITCTLRFFLFRIGENKLMKIYGKRKRFSFFDNIVNFFLKNPEIDEPFIEIIMDQN
jgi:DNA-directed RNA polymerase specialized sigma24 family protein